MVTYTQILTLENKNGNATIQVESNYWFVSKLTKYHLLLRVYSAMTEWHPQAQCKCNNTKKIEKAQKPIQDDSIPVYKRIYF